MDHRQKDQAYCDAKLPTKSEIPTAVWLALAVSLAYFAWDNIQCHLTGSQEVYVGIRSWDIVLSAFLSLTGVRFMNWVLVFLALSNLVRPVTFFARDILVFDMVDTDVLYYDLLPALLLFMFLLPLIVAPSARAHFTILITLKGLRRKSKGSEQSES